MHYQAPWCSTILLCFTMPCNAALCCRVLSNSKCPVIDNYDNMGELVAEAQQYDPDGVFVSPIMRSVIERRPPARYALLKLQCPDQAVCCQSHTRTHERSSGKSDQPHSAFPLFIVSNTSWGHAVHFQPEEQIPSTSYAILHGVKLRASDRRGKFP